MVRTAAGIRISGGRSTKKTGKAAGGNTPNSGSGNKSKTVGSSSKLPPIPFQETPSWQKPITNFFKSNSPLKANENKCEEDEYNDIGNKETDNVPERTSKKLRLDSEESTSEHEVSNEVKESEEKHDDENCKETSEENKENSKESKPEFDEGAGSSKQEAGSSKD